jgi:hypothetical protein
MPILRSVRGRLGNKAHENSTRLDGLVHICVCVRVCIHVNLYSKLVTYK